MNSPLKGAGTVPEAPNAIRLEIPKSRIAADLIGIGRHLTEAAFQGTILQNWPGVVANLAAAAETVRFKQSEGALAWQLLLTGIGEALTELANEQPPTLINDADVAHITDQVGRGASDLILPVDFLDHPWDLSPAVLAKKTLLAWLAPPPGSAYLQDLVNLGRRFDSALVLGLHRTIRRDEARYRPLLSLREDPTSTAWQMLEDWRLYRLQLVADFRAKPVFDESFALEQIYVPLNAWHWVKQYPDEKGQSKEYRAAVRLEDEMLAWLRGKHGNGRLRLVSGGPGSGKSSAMKALSATLAGKNFNGEPTDVLLFPLQRFQWRTGIVESVAATLNTYADQMRHNPLHAENLRHRQAPLLLIFDGLDELTANTEVSEAISATFLRELNTALRTWEGRPVWAIVTGRDAIFGNIEGPTTKLPGERFHLLPYHVRRPEPNPPNRDDYHDPNGLLLVDNRHKAFQNFAMARGEPVNDLPTAYKNDDLHDVTSQPLLNYFFLTSGPDEITDGNLARIYGRLFKRLHARDRNTDNRSQNAGKPGAGLSQGVFDRVFETMAVAAWRTGGTRAASWSEVMTEAEREDSYLQPGEERLLDVFGTQMLDRGAQRPFRLAAAFFMRNQQATGVEFTHKSFGDYLYARRLVKALAAMADELLPTRAVEPEMLRRWEALTADQRMSHEVRRFVELEVEATLNIERINQIHDLLAPIVERVFREGWLVESATTMRRTEQRNSHMEEALFIAWHALWRPRAGHRHWTLGKNTGDLLWRALARQGSAHGADHSSVFVRCWSGADLTKAQFSGANLKGADLSDANLAGASFRNADLEGAVFTNADLSDANLSGAGLGDAGLQNANLTNANLVQAYLEDADLAHATLTGADLRRAILAFAYLDGADLTGADLRNSTFLSGEIQGAILTDTKIMHTDLYDDSDIEFAKLGGADISNTNTNTE